MSRRRGTALFCLGLVLGALSVSPAGAHVGGSVAHLWKHLRPLASKVFYTKAQSDARYYPKADADARFAARAEVDGRFYTKAESDGRYYSRGDSDSRYYAKPDADLRFELKGQGGQTFQSYCTRAAANPRSYPQEPCTARLAVTLDATGVVGEFTSLAVGADGMPIVSYRDVTNGDLKVVHCGNAACTSGNLATGVDTASPFLGYDTSIAIGSDGFPVVSYYDAGSENLKFLTCGNTACTSGNEAITVDSVGMVGRYTSVAVGMDGLPLVSYFDETNGDLRLARPPVS